MSAWLKWKIDHGLTYRGRMVEKLTPKGAIAKVLHFLYYARNHDKLVKLAKTQTQNTPRVYHQNVGGSIGMKGKTNGE